MKTCLVVDDSRVTRMVARQIVESFGFTCSEAEDGQQALIHCRQHLPDAVLLDWNMPVLSGYDFMTELRGLPHGKRPVVIFCTAERDITHIADAVARGANEYIIKPFDADMLRDKFTLTGLLG